MCCKEKSLESANKPKINSEVTEKPKQAEKFKIKLKGIFDKDDKFAMFYFENENEKYNAQQLVTTKVNSSDEIQEVYLEAPAKVYPMNIKLDFGSNKEQSSIEIYECVLEYKNKSYTIKGGELKKYFHFNDGIKMQSDSITFNLSTFKFRGKDIYNPYIRGKEKLTEVLDLEL